MDLIFSICGILGGMFTACGDLLLDLKGPDNVKRGKLGIMDSAWDRMDAKRFPRSILVASVGTPLIFLGLTAMARQLALANETFGLVFWLVSVVGGGGAFFIHTAVCLFPVIYKAMSPKSDFDDIEEVINTVYGAIRIPFWVLYLALAGITSFMVIFALFAGYLNLSPWYSLLTVPVLVIVGAVLTKVKYEWFCDLPFVIMPSVGMSMFGLLALLNQL